jgi:vacuolar protein sorting-associated protein 53
MLLHPYVWVTGLTTVSASYAQDPTKPIKPSTMAAACQVIDVLGPEIRNQFIERYVALELKEYRRIFKATDEAGQLDNITTRFGWFRRSLQTHETETGRVFPGDWQVGWHLTSKFIEITR